MTVSHRKNDLRCTVPALEKGLAAPVNILVKGGKKCSGLFACLWTNHVVLDRYVTQNGAVVLLQVWQSWIIAWKMPVTGNQSSQSQNVNTWRMWVSVSEFYFGFMSVRLKRQRKKVRSWRKWDEARPTCNFPANVQKKTTQLAYR